MNKCPSIGLHIIRFKWADLCNEFRADPNKKGNTCSRMQAYLLNNWIGECPFLLCRCDSAHQRQRLKDKIWKPVGQLLQELRVKDKISKKCRKHTQLSFFLFILLAPKVKATSFSCYNFIYLFIFVFLPFLGPLPLHMEFSRLGV